MKSTSPISILIEPIQSTDVSLVEDDKDYTLFQETDSSVPSRKIVPADTRSFTHRVSINKTEFIITASLFEDGHPAELWITSPKGDEALNGWLSSWSAAVSLLLQHKVPVETIADQFTGIRFAQAGVTSNPQIDITTSIPDYISRWLADHFPPTTSPTLQDIRQSHES